MTYGLITVLFFMISVPAYINDDKIPLSFFFVNNLNSCWFWFRMLDSFISVEPIYMHNNNYKTVTPNSIIIKHFNIKKFILGTQLICIGLPWLPRRVQIIINYFSLVYKDMVVCSIPAVEFSKRITLWKVIHILQFESSPLPLHDRGLSCIVSNFINEDESLSFIITIFFEVQLR